MLISMPEWLLYTRHRLRGVTSSRMECSGSAIVLTQEGNRWGNMVSGKRFGDGVLMAADEIEG
jgi:hypothetical protein